MDIGINQLVTLAAQGEAGSYYTSVTPSDVQTAITTSLTNYGLAPISVTVSATTLVGAFSFPWAATIAIRPSYGTDDVTVRSSVASAIQDATGYAASVSIQSLDEASAPDPNAPQPTDIFTSITQPISGALSGLASETNKILIGLALVAVVLVVVLGYGPNVKKLATVSA